MPKDLIIRLASLDDVRGIVGVYCSSIDKWYRIVDGKRVEASYDELSVEERFAHGGPWMSIETCSVHLNYVLINNQYPIIALLNDIVVGELELYVGEEKGVLGKTAFIDVLEVHREHRRRGIGRKLVEKAKEIALEHGCNTISVWPDPQAIGFYERCGINNVAYNIIMVEINLREFKPQTKHQVLDEIPREYTWYKDKYFVSPRILSSHTAWLKQQWIYAVELERIERIQGYIPSLQTVFIVENMWDDKWKGRVYIWIENPGNIGKALETIAWFSTKKGFNKLLLLLDENLFENIGINTKYRIIGHEKLLYTNL